MNNAKERERKKIRKREQKNFFSFLCRSGSITPLKWPMRSDWRKTPDAITTADWPSKAGGACAMATNQEGPFLRCPQMGDTCAFSRGPDNFIAHPPNWDPLGNSALSGDLNMVWPLQRRRESFVVTKKKSKQRSLKGALGKTPPSPTTRGLGASARWYADNNCASDV